MKLRQTPVAGTALILAAGFSLIAACGASVSPQITSVTPSEISGRTSALLLVQGSGFQPGDRLMLGAQPLDGVTWINKRLLSAHLPAGLPAQRYDVVVSNGQGLQAAMFGALDVGSTAQAALPSVTQAPTTIRSTPPQVKATLPVRTIAPRPTAHPTAVPTSAPTAPPTEAPATQAPPRSALDVSGTWHFVDTLVPSGETYAFDIVLKQQGIEVSGRGGGIAELQGTLAGGLLIAHYQAQNGTTGQFIWLFSADGNSFRGTFTSSVPNGGDSQGVRTRASSIFEPASPALASNSRSGRGNGNSNHNAGDSGN